MKYLDIVASFQGKHVPIKVDNFTRQELRQNKEKLTIDY